LLVPALFPAKVLGSFRVVLGLLSPIAVGMIILVVVDKEPSLAHMAHGQSLFLVYRQHDNTKDMYIHSAPPLPQTDTHMPHRQRGGERERDRERERERDREAVC
jgi:hypothetical protein